MKRIGILLNSTNCNNYLFETVSELSNRNQIELFFLLSNSETAQQNTWEKIKYQTKTKGLLRMIDAVLFKILTYTEYKIISTLSPKIKEHNKRMSLDEFIKNGTINLNPILSPSGINVRYPDKDINNIKSLNLDLIIRGNAQGILKGGILSAAKKGIISFHHGDNRWNRGSPPAFWEVYLRKPSTGFIIQILTEELDGGSVIFRGEYPTRRSYTENIFQLCNGSNPYLVMLILEYATSNHLPSPEESIPFGGGILTLPSFSQLIMYILRTGGIFISLIINQKVLRKHERWGVAFIVGSWRNANLRKGIQINNLPNRFFADPFVITKDERTVCYVEDYDYRSKKGCITAIEIIDNTSYRVLGPVIEEPFHMSFPFIFKHEKDLYMIPETHQSNSIRLYKCVEFPSKWVYQKDILDNVSAVDSMIFEYEGKWWLLTNMVPKMNSGNFSQLFAYYNSHPLSNEWIAHERNPIIFDSSIGRNGGLLDSEDDFPVRVRQKQGFNSYGASLSIAKITNLSTSSFREQEIGQIFPNFFSKLEGCHHIHSNGEYTVYDYVRSETVKR